jgi:hypothetical protein
MKIKSQHEMMGFVLIVLLVSVIGVVMLMFMVKPDKPKSSLEYSNLLSAMMYYTTDCTISFNPQYRELQDLIKDCHDNPYKVCNDINELEGKNVCDAMEEYFNDILDLTLDVSEMSKNKAYKLDIYYPTLDSEIPNEYLLKIERGIFQNCSARVGAKHSVMTRNYGTIEVELRVCVNK